MARSRCSPPSPGRLRRRSRNRGLRNGITLLEVLIAQHIGELLDLICGRIDVVGDWPFVLVTHLATGVMQRRRHRTQGAGKTRLLRADLRRRLLASRIVPSYAGPPRRYYRITESGRGTLAEWRGIWRSTRDFVDGFTEVNGASS